MSRKPRQLEVIPGLPHHLVIRGNNRRNLFSCVQDRLRFLRFMKDAPGAGACPVGAAALLTNHGHVIVTPPSAEVLSGWVKSFAQRYAARRNRERGSSGKVFEQRFWVKPIRTEQQLAATTAYVDLNAVEAGVSSRWTTLSLHAGVGEPPAVLREIWQPTAWWLGLGPDDETRRRQYREFALARQRTWLDDVVAPSEPASVDYAVRPTRPDGARVAEAPEPYDASGEDAQDVPIRGIASMDPQKSIVLGGLRARE